jgi:hypothetical protein
MAASTLSRSYISPGLNAHLGFLTARIGKLAQIRATSQ